MGQVTLSHRADSSPFGSLGINGSSVLNLGQ